jgi:GntR family transcriptional regulator
LSGTSDKWLLVRSHFFHPYPKYLQLRDLLRSRIRKELRVGDVLPPEPELAAQFRVSRETVRTALRGLEDEGLIRRRPRIGTVIAALPGSSTESRVTGLVEDFTALGLDTGTVVRSQRLVVPPKDVAAELGVDPEAAVLCIERIRHLNGDPLAYHEALVPFPPAKKLHGRELSKVALINELQRLGEPLVEEWQRIEATIADTSLAGPLRTTLGAPLLLVTRRLRTRYGRLALLFRTHFRADRYYYTVALTPTATTRKATSKVDARKRRTPTHWGDMTLGRRRGRTQ